MESSCRQTPKLSESQTSPISSTISHNSNNEPCDEDWGSCTSNEASSLLEEGLAEIFGIELDSNDWASIFYEKPG